MSEGEQPVRLIDLATHSAGLPRRSPRTSRGRRTTRSLTSRPRRSRPGSRQIRCYSRRGRRFPIPTSALICWPPRSPGPRISRYADLLEARIVRPLGLRDTTFSPSTEQTARILQGRNFDGSPMPNANTGAVIVGSGGLYSSARDLMAWLQWRLAEFLNERAAERLIDHAAYLWRDGLSAVFGMDEVGTTWTRWVLAGSSWRPRVTAPSSCRGKGRRPPGCFFLCRIRAGARDRRLRGDQCVRHKRGLGDGQDRQRPHCRACAAIAWRRG